MRPPVTPLPGADDAPRPPRPPRPAGLRVIAVGIGLEALVLVAAAVVVGLEAAQGGSNSVAVSAFLVLFSLGIAWMLVAACRTLWAGRHGGRAPIVVWQLMQGLIGVSLLTAGGTWTVVGGLALLVVAASVLVSVMTRPVVEATSG